LHIERNELEVAEQYLVKGVEVFKKLGYGPFEGFFELIRVYCMKNDLDKAREVYGKIKQAAEELDEKGAYAFEHWARGLIASTDKDWIGARDAFKISSELWSELKNPYNYAQTLQGFGRAASRSGQSEEARRSIDEARGVFTRLGARLDLAKIEGQL
jgi:pentatricopeptide repeat protein